MVMREDIVGAAENGSVILALNELDISVESELSCG
jgi:hypothetical protein